MDHQIREALEGLFDDRGTLEGTVARLVKLGCPLEAAAYWGDAVVRGSATAGFAAFKLGLLLPKVELAEDVEIQL